MLPLSVRGKSGIAADVKRWCCRAGSLIESYRTAGLFPT
jgi:hypothetical protein